MDCRGE